MFIPNFLKMQMICDHMHFGEQLAAISFTVTLGGVKFVFCAD
jgi:hypothetical protein